MRIREFEAFQDGLVAIGLAARGTTPRPRSANVAGDDLELIVRRIEALVRKSNPAASAAA